MMTNFFLSALLVALALVGCADRSRSSAVDGAVISAEGAWARPAQLGEGAAMSAAYMVLRNSGPADDVLLSASSPAAAAVELHETSMDGNMMSMRPVNGGLPIPANGSAELKPGGLHFMLVGLTDELAAGATVPLTLTFERSGTIEVEAEVRAP